MKKTYLPLLLLLLAAMVPPAAATDEAVVYNLVRVQVDSVADAVSLKSLGLDIVNVGPEGWVEIAARDSELATLKAAGFVFDVAIRDMASFYEKRLADTAQTGRAWPNGSMGGYPTFAEVVTMLDDWAVQYPNLISPKVSIGQSIQGRDLWAVKVSDNPNQDETEPECCFDSLIHAREPQACVTCLYYIKNLLEQYGTDPELTYLVDNREIWFVPVVNPDGYTYNQQTNPNGGGMWRKNRRNNGSSYGVDLNRNWDYKWGYNNSGSSPTPSSETYRGTAPFSEPETLVLSNWLSSRPIVTSWNTHTYSNLYLAPYGYDLVYPPAPDWARYLEFLADISAVNGYETGSIAEVLYDANGGATDWHYAVAGIFNITPEIGGSGDGFWPSQSRIIPLAEENFFPIKYWTWIAGSYVLLDDHLLADDNGDGLYFPGEPVDVTMTLRNKGLSSTMTSVVATISSQSPYVTIVNGTFDFGMIAGSASANNNGNPLKIVVNSDTPYGESITLDVEVAFDNTSLSLPLSFICGQPSFMFQDNFESDLGWTVQSQNITAGEWERAVPNTTSGGQVAPVADNPAGTGTYCYVTENSPAGGSYSSYDIDGGPTVLTSPVIDLSSGDATISLYTWYYSRESNDPFTLDISNNGGTSWTNVFTTNSSLSGWHHLSFNVGSYVSPTANVKVRLSAQDQPNNDIVEAGLDDFEVLTYESPIALALTGPAAIGTSVNVTVDSPVDAGLVYYMVASTATYPATPIGGRFLPIKNDWLTTISRDPANPIFKNFTGMLNGAGHSGAPQINVPNDPGLIGMNIYLAAVTLNASGSPKVKNISAPLPITIQ
jgi:carboxypeptidase T